MQISKKAQVESETCSPCLSAVALWYPRSLLPGVWDTSSSSPWGSLLTEAGSSAQVRGHCFSKLHQTPCVLRSAECLVSTMVMSASLFPAGLGHAPHSPHKWTAPQQLRGQAHREELRITPARLGQTPRAEPRRGDGQQRRAPGPPSAPWPEPAGRGGPGMPRAPPAPSAPHAAASAPAQPAPRP